MGISKLKMAQDLLPPYQGGHVNGGFNSRVYGEGKSTAVYMDTGSIRGDREVGYDAADKMIMEGKIFSVYSINGKDFEFKCMKDGDSWCCIGPDFVNLQESDCYAFGESYGDAIINYVKSLSN